MADLLFALLIIVAPVLSFVVVPGVTSLVATVLPAPKPAPKPAPALDERDLLDTDPREWVRQAENAVEFEEGGWEGPIASVMQMQRDVADTGISATEYVHRLDSQARLVRVLGVRRPRGPAPRLICAICGAYATPHTHYLEAK